MRKFFGALLVLLGTATAALGALELYIFTLYSFLWYQMVIGVLLSVIAIIMVVKGRGLYLSRGESLGMKIVMGRLMMAVGIPLLVFGAGFTFIWTVLDFDRTWFLGVEALVIGLIYLIVGICKARSGRKVIQKTAHDISGDSEDEDSRQSLKPQVTVCPECGKTFPPSQVYCEECGTLLKKG